MDVRSVKVHTIYDKQYSTLRTYYSLIDAKNVNLLLYFWVHRKKSLNPAAELLKNTQQRLVCNIIHFALFIPHRCLHWQDNEKTEGQQKDSLCLFLYSVFTSEAESHQIGAVNPVLLCYMLELSAWIYTTPSTVQHHPRSACIRPCGGLQDELTSHSSPHTEPAL